MHVAYLSPNSLEAPLVQSQVLPYLRLLIERGHRFSLFTFEASGTLPRMQGARQSGLDWQPVTRSSGRLGLLRALHKANTLIARAHAESPFDLLHARSYLPALICDRLSRSLCVPWLFDMRGFWVDEKVMKGSLKEGGIVYRWLKARERSWIVSASGLVSLTHSAVPTLEAMAEGTSLPPLEVIPTCVDLDRFSSSPGASDPRAPVFGYVGSLGPGYEGERVASLLSSALYHWPEARALVVTRSDPAVMVEKLACFGNRVEITSASHDDMPAFIQRMTVGLSFIPSHPAKDASCPTKLGEYLACGVPVISNPGIGDVDAILEAHRVGLLWTGNDSASLFEQIEGLLAQYDAVSQRCRACAESLFCVEAGAARYDALYHRLTGTRPPSR